MLKRKLAGFTLIELLVVIAIVGVLSTLAVIALGNARAKSRDSKRASDVKEISTALELYFADQNYYPEIITPGQPLKSPDGLTVYMTRVPSNPSPRTDGGCLDSDYVYTVPEGQDRPSIYNISTCLGSNLANYTAGPIAYAPIGTFKCGDTISDYASNQYDTTQEEAKCKLARVVARLSSLSLSGSPTNYNFSGTQMNYDDIRVTNATSSLQLTPSGPGSIIVNGTGVASGSTTSIPLQDPGEQSIIAITVTEPGKGENTYTLKVIRNHPAQTTPSFTPASGELVYNTSISISSVGADDIYYTTNGDTPTTSSPNHSPNPVIAMTGNMTLKALAVRTGYDNSAISSASYTLAPTPDLTSITLSGSPSGFTFSGSTYNYNNVRVLNAVSNITVTPVGAGTITVNGETVVSNNASSPIPLSAGAETMINVIATEVGSSPKSYSISVTRNFSAQTTPSFNPAAGAIAWGTQVTISSADATNIYYTTNGSDPTTSSTLYTTPITVSSVSTLKALAVRTGYDNSAIGSASYTQAATANLTNLVLSNSPNGFAFASGTYSYTNVYYSNGVSSITVTPTGAGTITVEGVNVNSGQASGAIALTAGTPKTITIVATETGKTAKTYTVTVTRVPAIGASFQGGRVAYIDGTGVHGFIVATADTVAPSPGAAWGCSGTNITTGTAIGTGNANTNAIVAACGTAGIAARLAYDLSLNGYTDWYLPSKDELSHIVANKATIGSLPINNYYWSSSQSSTTQGWETNFYDNSWNPYVKTGVWGVRVIRAF